jgi:hypothetical protein
VARQRGHQGSGAEGVNGVEEPASAAYQQPGQAERDEQEPAFLHLQLTARRGIQAETAQPVLSCRFKPHVGLLS